MFAAWSETNDRSRAILPLLWVGAALGAGLWSFWPVLELARQAWDSTPEYSYGYVVGPFALYTLWYRRDALATIPKRPSGLGFLLLAVSFLLQFAGAYFFVRPLVQLGFLVWLSGLLTLLAGAAVGRWALPAVGFLALLFPLPFRVETYLSQPLQHLTTGASCWLLQWIEPDAFAAGNVIHVGGHRLEVIDACSGLRMFMVFVTLSVGFAMVEDRPGWQRLLIVLLAVPIAVLCNVLRVTATGWLYLNASDATVKSLSHDTAGYAMIPLAFLLTSGCLWYLDRVCVREPTAVAEGGPTTTSFDCPSGERTLRSHFAVAALVMTIVTGFAAGARANRWGAVASLSALADRLEQLPTPLPGWTLLADRKVAPDAMRMLQCRGNFVRTYHSTQGGAQVTVAALLGSSGPLTLHNPDVCYSTKGFRVLQAPTQERLMVGGRELVVWATVLQNPEDPTNTLKVVWVWNDGSGWRAADHPRFQYAGATHLLKIQVVYELRSTSFAEHSAIEEFLGQFLPRLERQLALAERTEPSQP